MTTILGVVENGTVIIGADTQATFGWVRSPSPMQKVLQVNVPTPDQHPPRRLLLGFAGDVRVLQIISQQMEWPQHPSERDAKDYLVLLADAIRQATQTYGAMTKKEPDRSGSGCLVGYQGRLFSILQDFSVAEHDHAWGDGSGWEFALGAFLIQPADVPLTERVRLSLELAASLDIGTSAPFHIETL